MQICLLTHQSDKMMLKTDDIVRLKRQADVRVKNTWRLLIANGTLLDDALVHNNNGKKRYFNIQSCQEAKMLQKTDRINKTEAVPARLIYS